ncbi:hypothetical protein TNCV_12951 [Trichonephila clavipes]|nr:hypothetical protein TNCV_12951 [Trichonephila clavipes]
MHVKSVEGSNVLLLESGVVVKRGQLKYRPRQPLFKITRSVSKSPRVAEQCDVNIYSLDHERSLKLQLLEQNKTALPVNKDSVILVKSVSDLRPLLRSCTFESFQFSVLLDVLSNHPRKIEHSLKAGKYTFS